MGQNSNKTKKFVTFPEVREGSSVEVTQRLRMGARTVSSRTRGQIYAKRKKRGFLRGVRKDLYEERN